MGKIGKGDKLYGACFYHNKETNCIIISYEHSLNLQMQSFETKKRISYHLEEGSKHVKQAKKLKPDRIAAMIIPTQV